jgi:hypothetical protein
MYVEFVNDLRVAFVALISKVGFQTCVLKSIGSLFCPSYMPCTLTYILHNLAKIVNINWCFPKNN